MEVSPERRPENRTDTLAPPPSPISTGRRSRVTNDDALTDFLQHSVGVPDLILPDRIFPRQLSLHSPPTIDYQSLMKHPKDGDSASRIFESVAGIGCFQLINHGIPPELIRSAAKAAAKIFRVSPEKKAVASRSTGNPFGFDEIHGGDDEGEVGEEFVWCGDQNFNSEMEGVWPEGYSRLSLKLERLSSEMVRISTRLLTALREDPLGRLPMIGRGVVQAGSEEGHLRRDATTSPPAVCCVHRYRRKVSPVQWVRSLRYDLMKMLIEGVEFSHALGLHALCDAPPEFHVYSKKAWVSFRPDPTALIITAGDQIQAWSGGRLKLVMGRPMCNVDGRKGSVSMAFLCSPAILAAPTAGRSSRGEDKIISLGQQLLVALISVLVYHLLLYILRRS